MDVIAVVDDDESLRRSVANFLRSVGLAVETFTSAEDFLSSVERTTAGASITRMRPFVWTL